MNVNPFVDKTIRKRVMEVVEQRINAAQEKYNTGVKTLDETEKKEKEEAEARCKEGKVKLADKLVQEVVGKLL